MVDTFRGGIFERDALPGALTQLGRQKLEPIAWRAFSEARLSPRAGAVGTWSATPGEPLAEVLVVRDEDHAETMTWLNAYFSGLAPITQWCRVLPQSQAQAILRMPPSVGLGRMSGAWVGAILAECSVQAGGIQNLRDMAGSAAMSSATFAAGRAAAVWGHGHHFPTISRRHTELSASLREVTRPLMADALTPLWSVLLGDLDASSAAERRALQPLAELLTSIVHQNDDVEPAELVTRTAAQARDYFDLPELADCARGPQVERVRAIDRLGERLTAGPRSPVIDALLGLGASFIDPGAAVSPELLRRYARQLPVAPVWLGAFAGAMLPLKVLTDQGGLGRLISKALLASADLAGRPSADIAYDELVRWITPGRPLKLDVRGMSPRSLAVELVPGVTCAFAYGRADGSANVSRNETARPSASSVRTTPSGTRTLEEMDRLLTALQERVERLEGGAGSVQPTLGLPDPKDSKTRKGSRLYPGKAK